MSVVVMFSPDEFGHTALSYGATEAMRRSERLVVVNPTKGDAYVDRMFAGAEDVARLDKVLGRLDVDTEVRHDVVPDIAGAVLDAAAETAASLIVVGIRPRTPVGKLVLGSVAQRLILDATCPVLAVKPDGADDLLD
ncbi:universal stress protein [Aeromicrobium sp. SMF47]|uniref:Universal stress protein n=1 Tax=Aeromicrobium yanjiei TaxID=2662028 RepID=A0A5Q2MMK9_9ACTN|nr:MULTISPECIES: universal stress protein [Aeromicrobium]MRJ77221.1 universal stress protein [Aeromicrobium yanjiei]MRK01588.1 universal stress protein [Aeromicrobium sp. S22]QGG41645.1 universal stress protein [Aeromicrobium yanjiei]